MTPLCQCGRFMKCDKNGVTVEEVTEDGMPYKLWRADRYACPECGTTVITGFGARALVEHWERDYVVIRDRSEELVPGRHAVEGRKQNV